MTANFAINVKLRFHF